MSRHPIRLLAFLYTTLVVVVAAWTIHTAITMRASSTEHLLPAFTLMIVCFPASLSVPTIATAFPGHFDTELSQAVWITCCGLFQTLVLFLISHLIGENRRRSPR